MRKIRFEIDHSHQHTWFHFASLGEFEQGRTVLEAYRHRFPDKKLVVTFFSPSGYEVRANYTDADHVFYLPIDTLSNARKFVDLIRPEMVFFVKYEFWPNYFRILYERQVPLFLISGIFRKDQVFFKWYGGFFRKILNYITHVFVQDQISVQLLKSIGIKQASLSGDTRFDRVADLSKQHHPIAGITEFLGEHPVLVAGSTWSPDEALLLPLSQAYKDWKIIIAPHQVHEAHIKELKERFKDCMLFSELKTAVGEQPKTGPNILIIDNIGMLSYLYAYADIAYIGGGFGVGIHNTLEAATYGVPVVFGPTYHKFKEAKDLIALKAAFSIKDQASLLAVFERLERPEERSPAGKRAFDYVQQQAGATQGIMKFITQIKQAESEERKA